MVITVRAHCYPLDIYNISYFIAEVSTWSSTASLMKPIGAETVDCLRSFSIYIYIFKMPTVRKARSLVTSRELPSGLQIWGKRPLNALFSVGTMNPDTDSASEKSVQVIQGRVAHGTLYVRLTCPTMANRHNKLSQVPEF